MAIDLTIYIPTYRRRELDDCLTSLIPQLSPSCELIVSDNDPDRFAESTVARHAAYAQHLSVVYSHRRQNVGCAANIIRGLTEGSGRYLWIVGDDDRILPGSVTRVLQLLDGADRILLYTKRAREVLPGFRGTTKEWLEALRDKSAVTASTLITSGVWRRDCLDLSLGLQKMDTQYPLAWASLPARSISVCNEPGIAVNTTNTENSVPYFPEVITEWLEALCFANETRRLSFEETNHWNFVNVEQTLR